MEDPEEGLVADAGGKKFSAFFPGIKTNEEIKMWRAFYNCTCEIARHPEWTKERYGIENFKDYVAHRFQLSRQGTIVWMYGTRIGELLDAENEKDMKQLGIK
jgi:hypothetical protein